MSKVINGNIDLQYLYLEKIPDIFDGVKVQGNFDCHHNQLTSLQGAPEYVGGDFYCSFNQLTSLQGAPNYVDGDFFCHRNAIQFTEEQVRAVCQVKGDVYV
jgi:hypothetical protein